MRNRNETTIAKDSLSALRKLRPAAAYVWQRLFPDRLSLRGKATRVVSGIDRGVDIYLDRYGVPHVKAESEADAFFGLGYMHGRDRRFQMELFKLLAHGRLRELVGGGESDARLAEQDLFNRAMGFTRSGTRIVDSAYSGDRDLLRAYAAGVNEATERERLPFEFRLLGARPQPWTPGDSATLIAWFAFSLSKNWEQELGRFELIWRQLSACGSIDRALDIWKPRFNFPPHLIGAEAPRGSFESLPAIAPELVEYLLQSAPKRDRSNLGCAAGTPLPELTCGAGSNAWAVSGQWTGTGRSALAADPHLPLSIPPAPYLAHLHCENDGAPIQVTGGGFPGIPAILFGTNGRVAWGVTVNWADVTDLYVEMPVADVPGHYRVGNETLPFRVEAECFEARTSDSDRIRTVRSVRHTHHGPVLNDLIPRLASDLPLVSLKHNREFGTPLSALRALYQSGATAEARDALKQLRCITGHWVMADRDGNVAYLGTMSLPKRTRHLGTVPVPGWTGTYEWGEMVSEHELPRVENPAAQFVAAANNQIGDPDHCEWPVNFEGDVPFRYVRLCERLSEGSNGRPILDQMRELQLDCRDRAWDYLRPFWARALEPLQHREEAIVSSAVRALLGWSGDHSTHGPGPLLFHGLCAELITRALADQMPAATARYFLNHHNFEPVIFHILADPDNPVWRPLGGAAHAIRIAFADVVARLRSEHGADISGWNWKTAAAFVLRHPMGALPALSTYVNRGPLPTAGSPNSVNKHQFLREEWPRFPVTFGPVLRINVDLADLESSTMSIPGGQSGRPASRHYDDLLPLFTSGRGASMTLNMDRVASNARASLHMRPRRVH